MTSKKKRKLDADVVNLIFSISLTAVTVLIVFQLLILSAFVPSGSMEPKIKTNSLCITNRLAYKIRQPKRGDIVVFEDKSNGVLLIKRIVGMPGDRVRFEGAHVYINDTQLKEPYIKEIVEYEPMSFDVPFNGYFCLGDNRNHSVDARYWKEPYITKDEIISRLMVTIPIPISTTGNEMKETR